jgi:hypothetical protein
MSRWESLAVQETDIIKCLRQVVPHKAFVSKNRRNNKGKGVLDSELPVSYWLLLIRQLKMILALG